MKQDMALVLKAQMLKKLRRRDIWGGCHTAFDELPLVKACSW